MFNNLESFFAPVQKIAELNQAYFEKLLLSQQAAIAQMSATTEASMTAAMSINDADGFNSYLIEQAEIVQGGFEKAIANSMQLAKGAASHNEEIMAVVQGSIQQ